MSGGTDNPDDKPRGVLRGWVCAKCGLTNKGADGTCIRFSCGASRPLVSAPVVQHVSANGNGGGVQQQLLQSTVRATPEPVQPQPEESEVEIIIRIRKSMAPYLVYELVQRDERMYVRVQDVKR